MNSAGTFLHFNLDIVEEPPYQKAVKNAISTAFNILYYPPTYPAATESCGTAQNVNKWKNKA